jgi:ABC-type uncharacterized transport system permease subunit
MSEHWTWLKSLDAPFAFLLALPVAVTAAALLADFVRDQLRRRGHR